jgi:GTPase Era involved in 16S rRNA processing
MKHKIAWVDADTSQCVTKDGRRFQMHELLDYPEQFEMSEMVREQFIAYLKEQKIH